MNKRSLDEILAEVRFVPGQTLSPLDLEILKRLASTGWSYPQKIGVRWWAIAPNEVMPKPVPDIGGIDEQIRAVSQQTRAFVRCTDSSADDIRRAIEGLVNARNNAIQDAAQQMAKIASSEAFQDGVRKFAEEMSAIAMAVSKVVEENNAIAQREDDSPKKAFKRNQATMRAFLDRKYKRTNN